MAWARCATSLSEPPAPKRRLPAFLRRPTFDQRGQLPSRHRPLHVADANGPWSGFPEGTIAIVGGRCARKDRRVSATAFRARFFADYFTLFATRAHRSAPNEAPLRTVKKGMPHEVAASLDDLKCAGFRVAGPGGLAPAKSQGSIGQRWGRERRSCANASEPYSGDRPRRRARSGLK